MVAPTPDVTGPFRSLDRIADALERIADYIESEPPGLDAFVALFVSYWVNKGNPRIPEVLAKFQEAEAAVKGTQAP